MADADNYDQNLFIKDLIYDTIYPRAKTVEIFTALNLFAVGRSWIVFKLFELIGKLSLDLMILASDKISRRRCKLDLIHP